jgi:hypothetical protein
MVFDEMTYDDFFHVALKVPKEKTRKGKKQVRR